MSISTSGLFDDTGLHGGLKLLENLVQSSCGHSLLVVLVARQVFSQQLQHIVPILFFF